MATYWRDLDIGEVAIPGDRFMNVCSSELWGSWVLLTDAHLILHKHITERSKLTQRAVSDNSLEKIIADPTNHIKNKTSNSTAVDFSMLGFTDQQVSELKRIRKANKGGAITQRAANALAKEFNKAIPLGFSFDDSLTEWEMRGWKSFKSEWIKSKGVDYGSQKIGFSERQREQAIDILPCPFCGTNPDIPEVRDCFGTHYDIGCQCCGIPEISISIIDCFDRPRDHVHASWCDKTKQYMHAHIDVARREAIKQWNTRAKQ